MKYLELYVLSSLEMHINFLKYFLIIFCYTFGKNRELFQRNQTNNLLKDTHQALTTEIIKSDRDSVPVTYIDSKASRVNLEEIRISYLRRYNVYNAISNGDQLTG